MSGRSIELRGTFGQSGAGVRGAPGAWCPWCKRAAFGNGRLRTTVTRAGRVGAGVAAVAVELRPTTRHATAASPRRKDALARTLLVATAPLSGQPGRSFPPA